MSRRFQQIKVCAEPDVYIAAATSVHLAQTAELTTADCTRLETAVSELARNLILHAGGGIVTLDIVGNRGRVGVQVCTQDSGVGIANVSTALQDGFTTRDSLGIGLGVARRMMDDFSIRSHPGWGTQIRAVKWK